MHPPDLPETTPTPHRNPVESGVGSGLDPALQDLTIQAFQLRSQHRYALHPVEAALQYHGASTQGPSAPCDVTISFEQAESHYRAGSQGLRISEISQLPQQLRELSRLSVVDLAGRKSLRKWCAGADLVFDEAEFLRRWEEQGKPGGAEHQVFHDKKSNRWFKRLYHGVNSSTLGDYLARMRLHAVLFPESAYRLEGFTINTKSKKLAPVVSQAHIEVDTTRPPVSKEETDDLMASMGFAPVQLIHDGVLDDGYFAYLHHPRFASLCDLCAFAVQSSSTPPHTNLQTSSLPLALITDHFHLFPLHEPPHSSHRRQPHRTLFQSIPRTRPGTPDR